MAPQSYGAPRSRTSNQSLYDRPSTIPTERPDASAFRSVSGKCPRRAFGASSLMAQFLPPVDVRRRLSKQLIQLTDGRAVHIKNYCLIW